MRRRYQPTFEHKQVRGRLTGHSECARLVHLSLGLIQLLRICDKNAHDPSCDRSTSDRGPSAS